MCTECGCGLGESKQAVPQPGAGDTAHGTAVPSTDHHGDEPHDHPHQPPHHHDHADSTLHDSDQSKRQVVELNRSLLTKNERIAERNRGFFRAKGVFVINVLSSPGSGKTTLIQQTALASSGRFRTGVIVGDLATDNDAARLRAANIPAVQVNTGTVCHLDAAMIEQACAKLDLDSIDLLIIENVGNLVCPAAYDLGENLRVVLLSVTEGEDKPLKYPPLFHSANVALITKSDLAAAAGWNRENAIANLRKISHHAVIFELSAKTGEGMSAWLDFLSSRVRPIR
ncbi:MAG: hydrogenase nickel incorporation protein HypB [Verrucomicrobia bacterium]|nr:hydrogenase nickel incorporation protein HypB [Verrucomicrobiota bacterium]